MPVHTAFTRYCIYPFVTYFVSAITVVPVHFGFIVATQKHVHFSSNLFSFFRGRQHTFPLYKQAFTRPRDYSLFIPSSWPVEMAQAFLLFCAYIKPGSDRSLFKAESGNMPTNPAGVPDDEHASSSSLGLRDGRGHPAVQLPAPHVRRARFFQLKVPASRAESIQGTGTCPCSASASSSAEAAAMAGRVS